MGKPVSVLVASDIHYAGAAERERLGFAWRGITNPLLRLAIRAWGRFVWLRDPFAHNALLDRVLHHAPAPDLAVANGDYSCDSAFVGVSDPASLSSAAECLGLLRRRFGANLHATIGDHELGKTSLIGGLGGLRLASWRVATEDLALRPFWRVEAGRYVLLGITSSVLALPVYEKESLPGELAEWRRVRAAHLDEVRNAFEAIRPEQRAILFCHDPTALPFLWREEAVRRRLPQLERTYIGHLHSRAILWQSRLLAGMPAVPFLGHSVRRMSEALREARLWKPFRVRMTPSLAGIELLKDGGYCTLELDPEAKEPLRETFHALRR